MTTAVPVPDSTEEPDPASPPGSPPAPEPDGLLAAEESVAARRLPSLTSLRFFAALAVLAFHATGETRFVGGGIGDFLATAFGRTGTLGVGFFFVLSGFVLTWSARSQDTARAFWRRRAAKIFPNHLVTLVVAAALILGTGGAITGLQLWTNVLLVQTWLPSRLDVATALNGVSWSLAVELLFYALFPFLYRGLRRIKDDLLWPLTAVVIVLLVTVPLAAQALLPATPKVPTGDASVSAVWFVYFFPPARLGEFVLGMLVARLVLAGRWPRTRYSAALAIAAVGYVVALTVPSYPLAVSGGMTLFLAPLIAAGAQADRSGVRTFLQRRSLVWLGEVSFAFYMVHRMVIVYGHQWLGGGTWPPAQAVLVVALLAGISLLFATALYLLVERPFLFRFGVKGGPGLPPWLGVALGMSVPASVTAVLPPEPDAADPF